MIRMLAIARAAQSSVNDLGFRKLTEVSVNKRQKFLILIFKTLTERTVQRLNLL